MNVNRRFLFVLSVVALLYLCNLPNGLASVGGTIGGTGTAGTLYANLTPHAMNFELTLTNFVNSTDSAFWTDADGKAQTVTVAGADSSTVVSSSLPANGVIVWSSTSSSLSLEWQLERAPATSVGPPVFPNGLTLPVPSSGTLYTNLTAGTVTLDVSVQSGGAGGEFIVSWTDAGGHARTITLGDYGSEGVSTSLSSGGTMSWTASGAPGQTSGYGWQVERVVK